MLAIAATMQVIACLPNFTWGHSSDEPMLELDVYENPFRDESDGPLNFQGKVHEIPKGPGLGIEVDEEAVRKYQVKPRP